MKDLTIRTLTLALLIIALAGCDSNDPDADESAVRPGPGSLKEAGSHHAAIQELQSAFHGALRNSDSEAILSLWADNATLQVGESSATGPKAIAEFFQSSPPFVNGWAALSPSYKARIAINGDRAEYGFECIYVAETGTLAGNEVVAHLNATGTMRLVGNRWFFESFQGGAGPLP